MTTFLGVILGIYFVVIWIALAYWALNDARARSDSAAFHLFAMGVNLLFPVLGLFVYLLVRPGETIADRRVMELEAEVLAGTSEEEASVRPCPACGRQIEADFVLCPYCHTRFAKRCTSCHRAVRLGWTLCPYCAHTLELGSVPRVIGND
jgi:RNA polymerase subunit RPABC4/transcription elongation factor Spt4